MNHSSTDQPTEASDSSALGNAPEDEQKSQQSKKTFSEVLTQPTLVEALRKLDIEVATRAQEACIPLLIEGRDVILQAQTGSGKTFAYALPLLERIDTLKELTRTYALIVTPTRELATQVRDVILSLQQQCKPCCLIGGASMKEQQDSLRKDARIVIGTPGRILDFIRQRELKLRQCEYVVLDEADEMLSMGFIEDVRAILARLPDKRQGAFISATINPRVQMLARSFLTKPEHIVIESDTNSGANIEHLYCDVGSEVASRAIALCDLIETQRPRSTIIFCNTKSDTELVEAYLRRRGFDACRINSDLNQKQRDRIMKRMRDGDLSILVATDVAARGIDIDNIDVVFNYSVPLEIESYVHRTGRTARAGMSGKAITLVSPHDFQNFFLFRKEFTGDIQKLDLPSAEETAQAGLAHFYERVREETVVVSAKTAKLATSILKDLGDIEEPSEELAELLGKLMTFTERALEKNSAPEVIEEGAEESDRDQHRDEESADRSRRSSHSEERGGGARRSREQHSRNGRSAGRGQNRDGNRARNRGGGDRGRR